MCRFSSRAIIAANGSLAREVPLTGKQPTNLTFGGPDGRTVFVTQKEGRFIEAFRVDRPGREPCLHASLACKCLACAETPKSNLVLP
jgi:sugar lactone lactonase YvrE